MICENRTQNCPCTTGIQQCVSAWWVAKCVMEVHKIWCLEVLLHFFSHLKEEQMGPWNPWWHCETWAHNFTQIELHWTHPSSLTATKWKVCQYAVRLWHLYSMLQEASELHSFFEIQKWIWTNAVPCCPDCSRLLAGRAMNICHEVWSFSTVTPIQYTTNSRSCCSLEM